MSSESLSFGSWLREMTDRRGWIPAELARAANTSTANVARWMNDQATPDPASCRRIAEALQLDEDEVLIRAGHKSRDERDLLAELDPEVRWYFLNYKRLPEERQKLLLRQLRAYYEDLGLPDPTKDLLESE